MGKDVNRGYFNTWPGLTAKDIHKMTKDEANIKGNLTQSRKTPNKQQPTREVAKTRGTQILYKNYTTTRQSS